MNRLEDQEPLGTTEVVDTDDWGFRAKITIGNRVAYVQVLSLSKLCAQKVKTQKENAQH